MMYKPLSNYLRMHRKRHALTQGEVAVLLGVEHQPKVSKYESGKHDPPLDVLLAYECIFKTSLRELFTGEDSRVSAQVRHRAQGLYRHLDAKPFTPLMKRKLDFLTDLIYSPTKA